MWGIIITSSTNLWQFINRIKQQMQGIMHCYVLLGYVISLSEWVSRVQVKLLHVFNIWWNKYKRSKDVHWFVILYSMVYE